MESIDQHNFENVLMHRYMGEDSFFVKREYKEWNKIEMEILSNDLILIFERYLLLIVGERKIKINGLCNKENKIRIITVLLS